MMYSLAIFDLDGTLLNTLNDLHQAVNFALDKFGFPQRTIEEIRSFIGNGVKKLIERSVPKGTDKQTEAKCLDAFREYYLLHMSDSTVPYKNVTELLKELGEQGVATAVVSNKLHSAVEELCEYWFGGLIGVAIGVSDESERKPCPVNVLRAIAEKGVPAEAAVYIGDSEIDVQTAHNAGIKCIGVTWGYRDEAELERNGCDFIAHTADEVFRIITDRL